MLRWNRYVWALIALAALITVSVQPTMASTPTATPTSRGTCSGPDGNGLIVYLDVELKTGTPEAGDVLSALVVFSSDGKELHRTAVDGVPTVFPLNVNCTFVVNGSDDQAAMLFDVSTGELKPITMAGGETPDNLYPAIGWQQRGDERRWAVMTDGDLTHSFLLDTQSARLTDLTPVIGDLRGNNDVVVLLSAAFTPNQRALLLVTDRDTWVLPPSTPSRARLIDGAVVGRASLSSDGTRVAYIAKTITDTYNVVTERLDGSNRQFLGEGDRGANVYWIGEGTGHLLVVDGLGGPGSVRDYINGNERVLDLDLPGYLAGRPYVAPSGDRVLLRVDDGEIGWIWVDLETGASERLTDLDGYSFPYSGQRMGLRWLTFFPSDMATVEPGSSVLGVDLETGVVSDLLTFDFPETYAGITPTGNLGFAAGGRYVVINDFGKDYPRFWLLDLEAGTSTEYAGQIAGMFSPDGSKLVVASPSDNDDNRIWTTSIVTITGESVVTLGESAGRGGFWVPISTR